MIPSSGKFKNEYMYEVQEDTVHALTREGFWLDWNFLLRICTKTCNIMVMKTVIVFIRVSFRLIHIGKYTSSIKGTGTPHILSSVQYSMS